MQKQTKVVLDGNYLKAFLLAYEAHKRLPGLASHKKQIQNYRVEFSEDKSHYYVHFLPKMTPIDEHTLGFETSLGRQNLYQVRKKDFVIVDPAQHR